MEELYREVLGLVKDKGLTISHAVKICGVNRTTFYRLLTKEQKQELKRAKVSHRVT